MKLKHLYNIIRIRNMELLISIGEKIQVLPIIDQLEE